MQIEDFLQLGVYFFILIVTTPILGILLFVLLTVFLAGLMVGRTPEYLG